ncbi:hypothetical protein ASG12_03815 [Williamsia sp. Leaf354]|uniref:hypothetical protein n=1 Tax=Williamsia sp. Leaf354 TaxID=1736349 RepID=UPI0006F46A9F|nr:hypothetical protein [Williamsia sp. Leaf354]KQR99898.1 hypothetical protein ASG12_03815 [Williamsia sp. Leaf354]
MTATDRHDRVEQCARGGDGPDDGGFGRITSRLYDAALNTVTVVATIVTAAGARGAGPGAMVALLCSAGILTIAHLGLQFQAAVAVLRDGAVAVAVLAACVVTTSLVALYLLATGTSGGLEVLAVTAGCSIVHGWCLAPSDRHRRH